MISIIVPIYNAEQYIHRCVDSILAQSYTDFELLLIDDGSTDSSGVICDEYAAKDFRVRVFHKPNGGVSSARNLGLDNARGKWITFVDADDWVAPQLLEGLYDYCYCDLVVGSFIIVDGGRNFERIIENNQYDQSSIDINISDIALKMHFRTPWGILYKQSIIEGNNLSFDENICMGEDTLFLLNYLLYVNTLQTIDKPYYYYCAENVHSLSKNNNQFESCFYAIEAFYKTLLVYEKSFSNSKVRILYLVNAANYIGKQINYLYCNSNNRLSYKLAKINLMRKNPYIMIVLEDRTLMEKRKKKRIFDFLALKGNSLLLLIYIYICRGRIY